MLRLGIVSKERFNEYYTAISDANCFQYTGIFDPSFQFEIPEFFKNSNPFQSFEHLLQNIDVVIFASTDKIYLPLIELAIKKCYGVFLHGAHNLNMKELHYMQLLSEEADCVVQIHHPFVFHDAFTEYANTNNQPLLINSFLKGVDSVNLLPHIRDHIMAMLCLSNANIQRIIPNTISSFSEIPDILKVRIDFSNSCIGEIHVNSIEHELKHYTKVYSYNKSSVIDYIKSQLAIHTKEKSDIKNFLNENNTALAILTRQLKNFKFNVLNQEQPLINPEKQAHTQIVVAKIKEKLRLCINL